MKIETYIDARGEHRWRLRADNGEIVIPPEGYKNKSDMLAIIGKIRTALPYAKVVEVED